MLKANSGPKDFIVFWETNFDESFVIHYLVFRHVGEISYCNCSSLPTSICAMSLNSRWISNLSKPYVPVLSQSRKILHLICGNKTGHFRCTLMLNIMFQF